MARSSVQYFSDSSRWEDESGWFKLEWLDRLYTSARITLSIADPEGTKRAIYKNFRKIRVVEGVTNQQIFEGRTLSVEVKIDEMKGKYVQIVAYDYFKAAETKKVGTKFEGYTRSQIISKMLDDCFPPAMWYKDISSSSPATPVTKDYTTSDQKVGLAMETIAREEPLPGGGYGYTFYVKPPRTFTYKPVGYTGPSFLTLTYGAQERTDSVVPIRGEYSFQEQPEDTITRVIAHGVTEAGEDITATAMGTDSNHNGWSDDEEAWQYVKEYHHYTQETADTTTLYAIARAMYESSSEVVSWGEVCFGGIPYYKHLDAYTIVRCGHKVIVNCSPEGISAQPMYVTEITYTEPEQQTKMKMTYPGAISFMHSTDLANEVEKLGDAQGRVVTADSIATPVNMLTYSTNIVFEAIDYRRIKWSGGTIYFSNGKTLSINAKSSYSLSKTGETYYIYWQWGDHDLGVMTNYTSCCGPDKGYLASAQRGEDSGDMAFIICPFNSNITINRDKIMDELITELKLAPNAVSAEKLYQSMQPYTCDVTWTADTYNKVSWSEGYIRFANGPAHFIQAGSETLTNSLPYYIYFDTSSSNPSKLQKTTSAATIFGNTKGLVATVQRAPTTDGLVLILPNEAKVPSLNANVMTANMITAETIRAGAITASKISAGQIQALHLESELILATIIKLRQGTGTAYIDITANGIVGYNDNKVQFELRSSDGKIYAGAGAVVLDRTGIQIIGTDILRFWQNSITPVGAIFCDSRGVGLFSNAGKIVAIQDNGSAGAVVKSSKGIVSLQAGTHVNMTAANNINMGAGNDINIYTGANYSVTFGTSHILPYYGDVTNIGSADKRFRNIYGTPVLSNVYTLPREEGMLILNTVGEGSAWLRIYSAGAWRDNK